MKSKVKILYTISILLTVLSLILPLAALLFLPDSIPAHYNAAGVVDRWGSKYEILIFPAFIIPYSVIWTACGRLHWRGQGEKASELIWIIGGVVQLIIFVALQLYFLYADFRQVERLDFLPIDIHRFLCALCGLGLIALGNWMPKLKQPGPMGLRTPWSMKNETVWRKCQRFGGWSMAAAGVASIAAALLVGGVWCWLWMTLALIAACAAGTVYSYRIAKAEP